MRNIVLQILAALPCVLFVSCTYFMPPADFTSEGMEGKWYITGVGTNAQWLKDPRDNLKTYTVMTEICHTRDLHFSYSYLREDCSCWRKSHLARVTDTPGRFNFTSDGLKYEEDMRFVDVVHNNYIIAHKLVRMNGTTLVINSLYSRTTQASVDLQEKFKQFSLSTGVLADNNVILPPNGECPPA